MFLVFALRLFGQPAQAVPAIDAPPPPPETQLSMAAHDSGNTTADDPSDLDDDDDDDDVALPVRYVPVVPAAVTVRSAWSIACLVDTNTREPLFRPPRHA